MTKEQRELLLKDLCTRSGWYYTLYPNVRWEDGKLKSDKYIMSFKKNEYYEQAALNGIEFVLDNLI